MSVGRVIVARPTGFCFGVERAIRTARRAKEKYGRVFTLGALVHNPQVLKELESEGIGVVKRVEEAADGALVIRAHGCPPDVIRRCQKQKIRIVDATCPYVRKVQNVARRLVEKDYKVVVVGEKDHPEVRSILGHGGRAARVYTPGMRLSGDRIGVVAQTTMLRERLQEAVANLSRLRYTELRVFDTICGEVVSRQAAASRIAAKADVVIVVGGRNSANTMRLAELVREAGKELVFVESAAELDARALRSRPRVASRELRVAGCELRVGVVAGSSTPAWVVEEVASFARGARAKCAPRATGRVI